MTDTYGQTISGVLGGATITEFEIDQTFEALQSLKNEVKMLQNELQSVKDTVSNATPFPVTFYADAADMLQHLDATGQQLTTEQARDILRYAADVEGVLECLK